MKKFSGILLTVCAILTLTACTSTDEKIEKNLQSNKWNVVSTNGESYTGEFSKNTVSFKSGVFSQGFKYNVEDSIITLTEDKKEVRFVVKEEDGEFEFLSKNQKTKDQYGDLTLSKIK